MNTFRRLKRLFPVDISDVLIVDAGINGRNPDAVDAEGQDGFIIGRIHDGVDVQLIFKGLLNCGMLRISHGSSCTHRKNRSSGETEHYSYYGSLYTR